MTIFQALESAKNRLGAKEDVIGVEVLLAFALGVGREFLISHPEFVLSKEQEVGFLDCIRRFSDGEPVAYLTGHKEFFGLDFFVDRRVLIPRPETEFLVDKILDLVKTGQLKKNARILEVGTGSGCIPVSLAKNNPAFDITAVDISADALDVAMINAKTHGVHAQIHFLESDLLAHFHKDVSIFSKTNSSITNPFDLIVANLPYIGRSSFSFVSKETYDYEPHLALFAGEDGLMLYEKLFQQIRERSWKPNFILGEFGFLQRNELERVIRENFSEDANALDFFADYAKIDRVFMISPRERT